MKKIFLILTFLLVPVFCMAGPLQSGLKAVIAKKNAVGGCTTTVGVEKNTTTTSTANADASEADATTGWTASGATLTSDGTPQLGSYAVHAVSDASGEYIAYAMTGLSLTAGSIYRIVFQGQHDGTGANEGTWQYGVGSGASIRNTPYFGSLGKTANPTYSELTGYFIYNTLQDSFGLAEGNTDNDGGIEIDNLSIKEVTNFCLGDTERYTITDAASLSNETNDATEWTGSSATMESSTEQVADGTWSLKFTATGSGGYASTDLSGLLVNGTTYFIRFKGYSGGGDTATCGLNSLGTGTGYNGAGVQISATDPGAAWKEIGFSFTYTTGGNFRYFKCSETGANDNAVIYLDSISIKEIL